jgi:1-acyl-sn-glycerol-3-phosphate acyltransferase
LTTSARSESEQPVPFDPTVTSARLLSWCGDTLSQVMRVLLRVDIAVSGLETHAFAEGPVVIAANHLSLVDTPLIRHLLPTAVRDRTFTVGARDFFAPAPSDRGIRRIARQLLCDCIVGGYRVCLIGRGDDMGDGLPKIRWLLSQGWNVIFFPEGTRSRTVTMGRFRSGVAQIARDSAVAVVPVHIRGTQSILPVGGKWIHSAPLEVRFGHPMRISTDESNLEFLGRLRTEIESLGRTCAAQESPLPRNTCDPDGSR